MEMLPSNRRPDNSGALAKTDPRALAVRQQYGDLPQLCKTFGVSAQRYCAKNVEKAVRSGVPTFAVIVRTYGEDGVAGLIGWPFVKVNASGFCRWLLFFVSSTF